MRFRLFFKFVGGRSKEMTFGKEKEKKTQLFLGDYAKRCGWERLKGNEKEKNGSQTNMESKATRYPSDKF